MRRFAIVLPKSSFLSRLIWLWLIVFLLSLAFFPSVALAQSPVITITTGVVGEVVPVLGSYSTYIPDNHVPCVGGSLTTSGFPELYDVVGCQFGCPDGSHFNIPDCRDRFIRGDDGWSLGTTGGEAEHTLTIDEMPSHNHGPATLDRYLYLRLNGGSQSPFQGGSHQLSGAYGVTGNTGGGQPHNNLPPYLDVFYVIRYQQDVITFTVSSTPTITPTNTPTPTATPTSTVIIYLPKVDAYTHTLSSGKTLSVPVEISFGQLFVSGAIILVIGVVAMRVLFGGAYRE